MTVLTFWLAGEHSQDQKDVSDTLRQSAPPLLEEQNRTTERPYTLRTSGNMEVAAT